ncbi:1-deoxy-D-xylulose-5-phosphate reductoisomerase [Chloroflexota bacterium]
MSQEMKRIAVLGSTGSIGQQTLDIVRALPDHFQVIGLAAANNIDLMMQQINEFKPGFVYHQDKTSLNPLSDMEYKLVSLEEMASHPEVDTAVIATSGRAGLLPTLAAIKAGKNVALANKEPLVMAGDIITHEAKINNAKILPVDSEHSAIWQCLTGETQPASQIILTASGGPFRNYSSSQLEKVTPEQALKHPSWQMGEKVTIDSATLMNKGLEIIEAHWLFNIPIDNIKVLIHPQSIIHSMVEFTDGSVKAQLSYPDMRLPIQYALSYPDRLTNPHLPKIEWDNIKDLTFEEPDFNTFPCLKLAIEASKQGGTYTTVLCAADEVAVEFFLKKRIKFTDIPRIIKKTLAGHKVIQQPTLEEIMETDNQAREETMKIISREALC